MCTCGAAEGGCGFRVYTGQSLHCCCPVGRCDGDVAYLALQCHLCFAIPVHRGAGHLQCSAPLLLLANSMTFPSAVYPNIDLYHEGLQQVLDCQRLQSCCEGSLQWKDMRGAHCICSRHHFMCLLDSSFAICFSQDVQHDAAESNTSLQLPRSA